MNWFKKAEEVVEAEIDESLSNSIDEYRQHFEASKAVLSEIESALQSYPVSQYIGAIKSEIPMATGWGESVLKRLESLQAGQKKRII